MGTTFTTDLELLSRVVERDGLEAHETGVADLVRRARGLGLRGVALDVLGDRAEPTVARERALGRVGFLRPIPAPAHFAA